MRILDLKIYWLSEMINSERGFCSSLENFIRDIGMFSKIIIVTCVALFIMQTVHFKEMSIQDTSLNYYKVVDEKQYFRIFSAAFTHIGFIHILFNMCWTAVFGTTLEKKYGTIFMFALAF